MKINLIIVDDDEIDRYLLARLAKKSRYDLVIREFESGGSFSESLHNPDSDLIGFLGEGAPAMAMLDINMPGMNGFDVVNEIRNAMQQQKLAADSLTVLICSSSDHPQDQEAADRDELIHGYVVKPPTVEQLDSLIHHHCC
ncbi:response regulator [Stieleria marina]|uniref:Transcriptional regulator NarL n=1 Tax=Stieleria marina TaxID=1930275 RepID=A0A517NWI4_9BACT|nr:transcriptional regulator NarL [Planctomycetes bacterium K23_9]